MQPTPTLKMLEPSASAALGRSATWPPTSAETNAATSPMGNGTRVHISQPTTPTMAPLKQSKPVDLFEYELSEHPENHFLSPVQMFEYEDWAEGSDDEDAGEIDWDAGITDFALFDDDRRRAQQGQAMPDRWNSLLRNQASALERAVDRNRATPDPSRRGAWTPLVDDLPQLTPDSSPNLKDEFDIHAHCKQNASRRQAIPGYLLEATPADEETDEDEEDDDDSDDSDDDDLPVAYLVERARERRRQARQLERPGLRFSRTMSGKHHVWRRPSSQMYTLSESPEAERKAEMLYVIQSGGTEVQDAERGRRR
ncbi:hypothetical protein DOTSEDRAFT_44004 [Dothistroma septosporum NZE10]|uniref:Uncharacterized protein n=1 Tax=Dothistroma septosporum (strain NZE10 / CBS 128990) TaxID=675120 RepID=N1PQT4_DOTSN|nr:hypothetical protein DOTSEDRAFT_44004 [Dothistroma septosporum NZE10]